MANSVDRDRRNLRDFITQTRNNLIIGRGISEIGLHDSFIVEEAIDEYLESHYKDIETMTQPREFDDCRRKIMAIRNVFKVQDVMLEKIERGEVV